MPKRLTQLFFCLTFTTTSCFAAEEIIPAYNTYSAVPFIVSEGGLAADLVTYLNAKLKGKYQLKLTQIPRDTLNKTVINTTNFKGVVMFLSPFFVADSNKTTYHWTAPMMSDFNVVISLGSKKVDYNGPESLLGLKFGGIKGNRYANLEEHFGKSIQREDVLEELSNIRKIASSKIDVSLMPSSSYRFLIKQMGPEVFARSNLYASPKHHMDFERHLFVAKENPALATALDEVVLGMKSDPAWKAILLRYGLE